MAERRTFFGPPGAVPSHMTAAELALLRRADLTAFFDAKYADVSTKVTSVRSRKRDADGDEQTLAPASYSVAPYLIDTTDSQKGIEFGQGSTGSGNGRMKGGANAVLPAVTGPWTVAIVTKENASNNGIAWATDGPTVQMALDLQTSGGVVFYKDYSTILVAIAAGSGHGNNPHLWTVTHDGAGLVTVYKDGVSVGSASGVTFSALDSNVLRLGSVNSGGSDPFAQQEGYTECLIVGNSADADLLAAINAVVEERHPSWF